MTTHFHNLLVHKRKLLINVCTYAIPNFLELKLRGFLSAKMTDQALIVLTTSHVITSFFYTLTDKILYSGM